MSGSTLTVHFGRIGTEGRRTSKELASNDAALEAAKKLIEEKRKKGYVRRR